MNGCRFVINILVLLSFVIMVYFHYQKMLCPNEDNENIVIYAYLKFCKDKILKEYQMLMIEKNLQISKNIKEIVKTILLKYFKQNPSFIDIYFFTVTGFSILKWLLIIISNIFDIFDIIKGLLLLNELYLLYELHYFNKDIIPQDILFSHYSFIFMLFLFLMYSIYQRNKNN